MKVYLPIISNYTYMKKNIQLDQKTMTGAGVVAVLVILVSFWGGVQYEKSQPASAGAGRFASPAGSTGARGGRIGGGNGFVGGTIMSKDDTGITIKLATPPGATADNTNNAGSKIVFINDKTQVGKFSTGSAADLVVGDTVTVTGTPNTDGSVTAQMVQIRPAGMTGGGFGGGRGQGGGQGTGTPNPGQ